MTKEECGKVLRLGEIIMGSEAKFSAKRTIRVYRDEGRTMLDSGTEYIPGEMLLVVLFGPEERGIQFVFEAENAVFEKGGCDGKRIANVKVAKLIAPESSEEENDVHVIAGWSLGYGTVKITPPFLLVHPSSKVAVTKESQDEPPENSNHNNQEKLVNSNLQEAIKAAPIKLNLRTKATTEKVHEPVRAPPSRPKRHLDPTKLSFGTPSMTEEVKADTPHSLAAQPVVLKLPDKTMSAEAAVEKQNDQPPVQAETELVKQQQDIATQTENKPNHPPTAVVPTTETREGGQQHAGEREPETDTPAVHNAEKIKVEKVILLQQPKRTQEEGGGRGGGGAVIAEIPEAEALKQALAKIEELSESIKELKGAQNKNRNDNSAGGDSADGIPETEGAVPVENLASPGRAEHHEVVKGKKKGNTGERLRRNKKGTAAYMEFNRRMVMSGATKN